MYENFVGYGKAEKGYKVYHLATKNVFKSISVIFDEIGIWD